MPKQALYKDAAYKKLKSGIDKLAEAVTSTLGPNGKNVLIQGFDGNPVVTKDGVTVARHFDLEDPVERLGMSIVREASYKVNKVGDGTTTTTLLAKEITDIVPDGDVHQFRRDIQKHSDEVCAYLDSIAVPVDSEEMLAKVATISANNDPVLGATVAKVVWDVGKDGVVTVEEWAGTDIQTEKVEGFQIKSGYVAREMVTNLERMECSLNDVAVLVTDKKISSVADVLPLMEKVATGWGKQVGDKIVPTVTPAKQLVIIADDIEGDALGTLVINKFRAGFVTLAVRAPSLAFRQESLKDLAAMLGATLVSDENALKLDSVKPEDLGRAKKVTATKDYTTFIGGAGSEAAVKQCLGEIEKELEDKMLTDFKREKLYERKARLTGGVAIIRVGAYSESELKERKYLVDDSVAACKAALDGGIVAGGGVALARASFNVAGPLKDVLQKPKRTICQSYIVSSGEGIGFGGSADSNAGFDAKSGVAVPDMIAAGIIDPVKVVKATLQNAVSVASMLLTTNAVLYDEPEEKSCPGK